MVVKQWLVGSGGRSKGGFVVGVGRGVDLLIVDC